MPDISMCMGEVCPQKKSCYRHVAVPSQFRQTYFVLPPYDHEKKSCEFFSAIQEDDNVRSE